MFENDPLIFKLNKDWKGNGRSVPRVTKGHFIVIAPADWVRSGHVPVEPEGCSDPAFTAHYFFSDGDEATEDLGGFHGRGIPSNAPGFELAGTRVFDDSEYGDLFVATPPRLTPAERVVWARAGEERAHGWKGRNFRACDTSLADVLNGRQGRFFLRVYDEHGTLLDGDQFRYFRGLRAIRVNGEPYSEDTLIAPPAEGHRATTVRFVGVDGLRVRSKSPADSGAAQDGRDSLIVEPRPDADEVMCELTADGGRVDIALHLPRIWWRMEGDELDGEYRSTPFEMTRGEFRDNASVGAVVRLRIPIRVRSVRVGFDREFDRKYRVAKGEGRCREVELPLADFADHTQMETRSEDSSLDIRCDNKDWSLVRLLADPEVTVSHRPAAGSPKPPEACPGEADGTDELRSTHDVSCGPPWCWHPETLDRVVRRLRTVSQVGWAAAYYEFPVELRHDGLWRVEWCRGGTATDWVAFAPGELLAGEWLAPADDARTAVMLSASLAEVWFDGVPAAAVGRHLNARLRRGAAKETFEIAGVFTPHDDVSDRASSCSIVAPWSAAIRLKDRTRRITMEVGVPNENGFSSEMEGQINAALHYARHYCRRQERMGPTDV